MAEDAWLAGNRAPAGAVAIAVPDTLRAMGDLAAWHRRHFELTVVGITGSNGKTTTKEMLAAILGRTGPGLKTSGNLNNLIGLPQMLFRLGARDRWAVLEMGMSEPGEIDRLAEIAAPRIGVITNIHSAHLASMGDVAAVARAKGELFLRLPAGGWAVANADDPLVASLPVATATERISFGIFGGDVRGVAAVNRGMEGQLLTMETPFGRTTVCLRAFGRHSVSNALAATAAACAIGVPLETIAAGLEAFTPYDRRFSVEQRSGLVLVDDSYNANPASMRAALETLAEICAGRRIAVLGDMLELGNESVVAHRELGALAAGTVQRLYLLGEQGAVVADAARTAGMAAGTVTVAASADEIIDDLRSLLATGDCILVKGSRGMRMERVSEAVRGLFAADDIGRRTD
jgi:UDP-N-acetylmuramoyl-tripeptide--D-alanyl-D-alanine ligase